MIRYADHIRSAAWRAKRLEVIKRAGGTCERCREWPIVNVHHLTYEREAPTGTSASYLLRQLERGRAGKPARPDLLERVRAGELSPHAAAVEAGYERPKMTVEKDPGAIARAVIRHLPEDGVREVLRELANWAGYDLTPRA